MMKQFADFANRHPNRGQAVAPIALMMDHDYGFVPKHWLNNPSNVWYLSLPYSAGDWMIENFLNIAYSGYQRHGLSTGWNGGTQLVWTDFAAFQAWIAAGNDPRPYDPMPNSKWVNVFDVLLSNASIEALNRYKVVMFTGGISKTPALNAMLSSWVAAGGTLIVNSQQVTVADQTLLGVTLGETSTATASKWLDTGAVVAENSFIYQIATSTTATVLAVNPANNQPLITMNVLGAGKVYFVAPNYMQDNGNAGLLNVGVTLLSKIVTIYRQGWVDSANVDYLTTQGSGFTTVTVVNNSSTAWTGNVHMNVSSPTQAVEWTSDQVLQYSMANGITTIAATVPPYDVKVFAVSGSLVNAMVPSKPANFQIR